MKIFYNRLKTIIKKAQFNEFSDIMQERYKGYNPKLYKIENIVIVPIYAQKYKKQLRLSVIFSGAPFAEMERVLLKNQEMQIKNYINAVIKLGAMDYWEAQPFLEGFTEEEKL